MFYIKWNQSITRIILVPNWLKQHWINKIFLIEQIEEIYGDKHNWNGKIWWAKDVFENEYLNKEFYFEYESENGHIHWTKGTIRTINHAINDPMSTPLNQYPEYWENPKVKRQNGYNTSEHNNNFDPL